MPLHETLYIPLSAPRERVGGEGDRDSFNSRKIRSFASPAVELSMQAVISFVTKLRPLPETTGAATVRRRVCLS